MLDLVITLLPRARGGHGSSLAAPPHEGAELRRQTSRRGDSASMCLSPLLIIGGTRLATGAAGAPVLAICPPILTVLLASGDPPRLVAGERRKKNAKRRNRLGSGGCCLQFRLWAEQRGVGGMGEPLGPPKLRDSTAHAPAEAITPLYSTDYLFVSFTARAERSNSPRSLR